MTRHGPASPRAESLVLLAAIPLVLAPLPIDPATVSGTDPGLHRRYTPPPATTFRPADARPANRCARATTRRNPKSP